VYGDSYKSDYYGLEGRKTVFYVPKADYSSSSASSFNYYSDGDFQMYLSPTASTASMSTLYSGITAHGNPTISGEDSFSFKLGGTISPTGDVNTANSKLYTTSDSGGVDYVSWGYWEAEYNNGSVDMVKFGTWVGGALTKESEINALVTSNASATYKGQSIGGAVSSGSYSAIAMNANNAVNLTIKFGAAQAINGSINFDLVNGEPWRINVSASVSSTMQFDAASSSFRAFEGAITGTGSNSGTIESGTLDGKFYGPNAKTIGGSFKFVTDGSATASGVFKANKQ
jgi:hypothetical protein